jgi:hypothetical protein
VEEYDQQSLFPTLWKCYHILHPMENFGPTVDMQIDEENSINILTCLLELMSQ